MAVPSNNRTYNLFNELKQDANNVNDCLATAENVAGGSVVLAPVVRENMNYIWQFLPTDTEGTVSIQNWESRLYIGINDDLQVIMQTEPYNWILTSDAEDEFKVNKVGSDYYLASEADNNVILASGTDPDTREKDRKWKYQLATVGF